MDFTREPIIESVITPREGCKLVVRSSRGAGQEEFFVDAIEVVSFGHSFFFRSLERPKSFLVPATDYEVIEVREPRLALKNVSQERRIKIAGGRAEQQPKAKEATREEKEEKAEPKKKDKKQRSRRRGRGGRILEEESESSEAEETFESQESPTETEVSIKEIREATSIITSLLPPPPTLISEEIQKYKQDDMYKNVFYEEENSDVTVQKLEGSPLEIQMEADVQANEDQLAAEQHVPPAEEEKTES